ncbi:MAG: serine acetyltransferase [Lentisphaerae bacterium]|nr:serine acetyltransferase [Lentisphaerota bacterium]
MQLQEWLANALPDIAVRLTQSIQSPPALNVAKSYQLASREAVHTTVDELVAILFPVCHAEQDPALASAELALPARLQRLSITLAEQLESAFRYQCELEECLDCTTCQEEAQRAVIFLMESLPDIHRLLRRDIQAAYEGDPAARSIMEIVMSYPYLQAIAIHRIAHQLYLRDVPLIPRVMSELAHSRTGIDIHPGAKIGGGFFIDHGTGVVIGETCIIGENVKIYQGVTLGALSFPKDAQGKLAKGLKRHPEVRDNVTIYAGATILGGETVVGEGAVIGGNVWLTHSVPAQAKVYNQPPQPRIRVSP